MTDVQPQPGTIVSPSTAVQTEPSEQTITLDPAVVQAAVAAVIAQIQPVVEAQAAETTRSILDDFKKSKVGTEVVTFFNSAIGKSFQTLLWTAGAYAVTVFGAWVANVHLDARWISLGVPGFLNWLVYTLKVLISNKVPNLPTSAK